MLVKRIACSALIIILIFTLCSCSYLNTPPSAEAVRNKFLSNYDNIMIVVNYILDSGYESVQIKDAKGTMWADFNDVDIKDESVIAALKELFKSYYAIYKDDKTIEILQWKALRDIGCGVCYSLKTDVLPNIQYCTELVQITVSGWYYYVDDYEKSRFGEPLKVTRIDE